MVSSWLNGIFSHKLSCRWSLEIKSGVQVITTINEILKAQEDISFLWIDDIYSIHLCALNDSHGTHNSYTRFLLLKGCCRKKDGSTPSFIWFYLQITFLVLLIVFIDGMHRLHDGEGSIRLIGSISYSLVLINNN